MTWQVTYRTQGGETTAVLDDAWALDGNLDPGALDSPEAAAWYLALTLGAGGLADEAELTAVTRLENP